MKQILNIEQEAQLQQRNNRHSYFCLYLQKAAKVTQLSGHRCTHYLYTLPSHRL